jgi:hypothetical protein
MPIDITMSAFFTMRFSVKRKNMYAGINNKSNVLITDMWKYPPRFLSMPPIIIIWPVK